MGDVHKVLILPALPGVLEGAVILGDVVQRLLGAGKADLCHRVGLCPLEIAAVFVGDAEDVDQFFTLPQVKVDHVLLTVDGLDFTGTQLTQTQVDKVAAEDGLTHSVLLLPMLENTIYTLHKLFAHYVWLSRNG